MKIHKIVFCGMVLLPQAIWAKPAVLLNVKGRVEIKPSSGGPWLGAEKNAELKEGTLLRTGEDGAAVLQFSNRTKGWLKPQTVLEFSSQKKNGNELNLVKGVVKFWVPHLKFKEKFNVRTPVAVASVRGTVFTLDADESGKPSLDVLFGEVNLKVKNLDDNNKEVFKSFRVTQGTGFSWSGGVSLLTKEEQYKAAMDWYEHVNFMDHVGEMVEKGESLSKALSLMSYQMDSLREMINDLKSDVKDADFSAGRTLVDVHGNLVRVDQRLERPEANVVQVVNVVKRSFYFSNGFRKYVYGGSPNARLDIMRAKVEFNKNLPDSINELPGFFSQNEDSVKVDRSELVLGRVSPDEIFTVGLFGKRDPTSGTDEIKPDLYVGTIHETVGQTAKSEWSSLRLQDDLSVPGLTRFVDDPAVKGIFEKGADGELYGNAAERWQESGNSSNKLWVAMESFIVDNGGRVRNVRDFTSGVTNIENVLKNTAGEVAVFLKADNANLPDVNADATNFAGGNANRHNIDLVIIPDLGVAAVKTIATGLDSINKAK